MDEYTSATSSVGCFIITGGDTKCAIKIISVHTYSYSLYMVI